MQLICFVYPRTGASTVPTRSINKLNIFPSPRVIPHGVGKCLRNRQKGRLCQRWQIAKQFDGRSETINFIASPRTGAETRPYSVIPSVAEGSQPKIKLPPGYRGRRPLHYAENFIVSPRTGASPVPTAGYDRKHTKIKFLTFFQKTLAIYFLSVIITIMITVTDICLGKKSVYNENQNI